MARTLLACAALLLALYVLYHSLPTLLDSPLLPVALPAWLPPLLNRTPPQKSRPTDANPVVETPWSQDAKEDDSAQEALCPEPTLVAEPSPTPQTQD
ncbi:hypothetical protein BDK51DRAFT_46188, partial [Blyttiomyces helicus]